MTTSGSWKLPAFCSLSQLYFYIHEPYGRYTLQRNENLKQLRGVVERKLASGLSSGTLSGPEKLLNGSEPTCQDCY